MPIPYGEKLKRGMMMYGPTKHVDPKSQRIRRVLCEHDRIYNECAPCVKKYAGARIEQMRELEAERRVGFFREE